MEQILTNVISFVVAVIVLRYAFGIDSFLKYGRACVGLLVLIAKKSGATKEEIDQILDKVFGTIGKKKVE